jgi:hypothetical protein
MLIIVSIVVLWGGNTSHLGRQYETMPEFRCLYFFYFIFNYLDEFKPSIALQFDSLYDCRSESLNGLQWKNRHCNLDYVMIL